MALRATLDCDLLRQAIGASTTVTSIGGRRRTITDGRQRSATAKRHVTSRAVYPRKELGHRFDSDRRLHLTSVSPHEALWIMVLRSSFPAQSLAGPGRRVLRQQ